MTDTERDLGVRYAVLGRIALRSGAGEAHVLTGHQATLLAHLLVHPGTVVTGDRLAYGLWGDDLPSDPAAALRSQVARLRRRLPSPDVLVTTGGGYRLDATGDEVDASRFERLVAAADDVVEDRSALELLDAALALWEGPAFADVADRDLVQPEAVRLEALRLAAAEQRAERLLASGDVSRATSELNTLIGEFPESERVRALLMQALYRGGRHTEALALFRGWQDHLVERGLEPAPELRRLESEILGHRLVEPPGPRARRHAPPRPVTSFVGRDDEVREATALLESARSVTLCGPGGVGKTRLALEVAARIGSSDADEVFHCDLSAVGRNTDVARAVANATGVEHRHAGMTLERQLIDELSKGRRLLVLDNCEHVLDATARLAERLILQGEGVRLLATSRERLGIDGEIVFSVRPLASDGFDSPSVRLFLDRARDVDPGTVIGGDELADVAAICRRVDGLPLAIELAAGRLRGLTPSELSATLDESIDVLEGGPRTVARHRSLRAVIDWSYRQLDPSDQELFDLLSIFAGPFDLEAAAVVSGELAPEQRGRVAAAVLRLVDCSLLSARRDAGATTYRMLISLRGYGRDRLRERGGSVEAHRRHGEWAIGFAEEAATGLGGPEEPLWAQRTQHRLDDLRSAHGWLVGHDPAGALRLSAALHPFAMWRAHGEVFEWAEIATGAAAGTHPSRLADVLGSAAIGMCQRGDLAAAEGTALAAMRAVPGNGGRGARHAREALADVRLLTGDLASSVELYRRSYEEALAEGDLLGAVWDLGSVAVARLYDGHPADATSVAEGCRRLAQRCGSPSAIAFSEFVLGEIAAATGVGGETHLEAALGWAERADSRFVDGLARVTLATLHGRGRDVPRALEHYESVITQWQEAETWTPQWVTLRHLVDLLERQGAVADAAILYGAVTAATTGAPAFGDDLELLSDVYERLRVDLGEDAVRRHVTQGASLDAEEVIGKALTAIGSLRSRAASEGR